MAISIDFDAPFDVQIAQARAQGVKLSDAYYALSAEKRAQAFTASGLAKLDQVQRVADELARAQLGGKTLREFQQWAKTQDWQLPKHRLETIYRNSAQTAYQAGHWRDFEENANERPFLMYDAINDSRVRPSHLALDGIIKPVGDAFWKTHAAPMGHRCRCTLRSLSRAQAMAKGGVTQNVPVEGKADEGWGHKPTEWGKTLKRIIEERQSACKANPANFGRKQRPVHANMDCTERGAKMLDDMHQRPDPTAPMPPPRSAQFQLLPKITDNRWKDHFNKFMTAIGLDGDKSGTLVSQKGHTLYLSTDIFTDHITKELKIGKEKRDIYLLYLADSIILPDEIWLQEGGHKDKTLMYLTRYIINGEQTTLLAAFKQEGKVWSGWSGYQSKSAIYLESKRTGELLWRRP